MTSNTLPVIASPGPQRCRQGWDSSGLPKQSSRSRIPRWSKLSAKENNCCVVSLGCCWSSLVHPFRSWGPNCRRIRGWSSRKALDLPQSSSSASDLTKQTSVLRKAVLGNQGDSRSCRNEEAMTRARPYSCEREGRGWTSPRRTWSSVITFTLSGFEWCDIAYT